MSSASAMDPHEGTVRQINMRSIQRIDPFASEILFSANHAALYPFNNEKHCWENPTQEGSLFLYKRSSVPFYSFIIFNKLDKYNKIEAIEGGFEVSVQGSFCLYKSPTGVIHGIWFFDSALCKPFEEKLLEILKEVSIPAPPIKEVYNGGQVRTNEIAEPVSQLFFRPIPMHQEQGTATVQDRPVSATQTGFHLPLKDLFQTNAALTEASCATQTTPPIAATSLHANSTGFYGLPPATQHSHKPGVFSVEHLERDLKDDSSTNSQPSSMEIRDHLQQLGIGITKRSVSPPQMKLMTPADFLPTAQNVSGLQTISSAPVLRNVPTPPSQNSTASTPPAELISMQATMNKQHTGLPLTSEQLARVLGHLLKTDTAFVRYIHDAYLNGLSQQKQ